MATQDRLPTGIGNQTNWTSSTGSAKYLDVDDAIGAPDDATSYLYRADSGAAQQFTYTAFDITASAVAYVRVTARVQRTATGDCNSQGRLRISATNYITGSASALTTSWTDYTYDSLTNPASGAAWTEAEVEGTDGTYPLTEFGLQCGGMATGEQAECTQVYGTVDYTAAASGNPWHAYAQQ
jgi:hypothetical protein